MPITWPSSTTQRSAPALFLRTRSARSRSFAGAREVHRSRGSVQWESTSITGIRTTSSVMAFLPGSEAILLRSTAAADRLLDQPDHPGDAADRLLGLEVPVGDEAL